MKVTKSALAKLIKKTHPEIVLSRDERNDINRLLEICTENGIEIEQAPSPLDTAHLADVKTSIESEPTDGVPSNEPTEPQTVTNETVLDESDAMFQRLTASRVESVPRGTYDGGFSVEVDNEPKEKKKRKSKNNTEAFNLDGYMLLMLIDMVMPTGIAFVFNMFEKNPSKKVQAYELGLAEHQMEKMQPLADRAAEALTFKMNPITAFVVMGGLMYANNLFILKNVKSGK